MRWNQSLPKGRSTVVFHANGIVFGMSKVEEQMRAALELGQGQRVIRVEPVSWPCLSCRTRSWRFTALRHQAAMINGWLRSRVAVFRRSTCASPLKTAPHSRGFAVGHIARENTAVTIVTGKIGEAAVERVMSEQTFARFIRSALALLLSPTPLEWDRPPCR